MFSTSTYFTYANQNSADYDIVLARTGGLPSYQVGISYEPQYKKIKYNDKMFFYGNEKNLYEFELELYKETMWTALDRQNVCRWLFQNSFQDLNFSNPYSASQANQVIDIIYNCQPVGKPESCDYGGLYGIKIKFLNSTPYPTTRTLTQTFDLSDITETTQITVVNHSNINEYFYRTILNVSMRESGSITLTNNSDGGRYVTFSNLNNNEIITLDNQLGSLISSTGDDKLDSWNYNYLRLAPHGNNYITVNKKCIIEITGRYPIIV